MKATRNPLRFSSMSRVAVLVAIGMFVVACAGGSAAGPILSTVGGAVDGGPEAAPTSGPATGPDDNGTGSSGGNTNQQRLYDAARPDLLIIKTGTMDLQVKDVPAAAGAAATAITGLGGYISASQQSGDGDGLTASVTYRIPAPQWDKALATLRSLSIKVVNEATQTQDVTGQVVDLTARITNLQATERALQGIMTKATKITDILDVQAELTKVRGDIEQATAEKQHLQEQASFSTLTVGFGLKPVAAVVISQQKFDPKDQVDRATASLVDILQGLTTAGIWFAIVWLPILLVLGILAGIAWVILRRRGSTGVMPGFGPGAGAAPPDAPAPGA